ncbi:MAG: VWA domain-containing protein [Deltaproteobacteria bacterium]|nr:MAG: VWA domain-containing protein [Deltaproteobacteria bacterium]
MPVERQRLARGKRSRQTLLWSGGRYIKSRLPYGPPQSIALDATLRAAAASRPQGCRKSGGIRIRTPDIREKMRVQRTAAAVLFLLDASGSMGANHRMVLAKGIILSLLTDAYHSRDQVGLLAFRAAQTELLLPFTRSPQVAKRRLRGLAVGGKTPLGLGLKEAMVLLKRKALKDAQMKKMLVVVSDGKGNVALEYEDPYDEAMHYARLISKNSIQSVFVDTEENPCSFGYGPQIARTMGAKYISAETIRKQGVIELPF